MIKANTNIRVGNVLYTEGQTVTGLSSFDKSWMSEAGYITVSEKKSEPKKEDKPEEVVNELS